MPERSRARKEQWCVRVCSVMCFFFSSRRRHTTLVSDWSSDVCSSDLSANLAPQEGGEPERVERAMLTPDMFAVLRVAPLLGRVFTPEEAQADRKSGV